MAREERNSSRQAGRASTINNEIIFTKLASSLLGVRSFSRFPVFPFSRFLVFKDPKTLSGSGKRKFSVENKNSSAFYTHVIVGFQITKNNMAKKEEGKR